MVVFYQCQGVVANSDCSRGACWAKKFSWNWWWDQTSSWVRCEPLSVLWGKLDWRSHSCSECRDWFYLWRALCRSGGKYAERLGGRTHPSFTLMVLLLLEMLVLVFTLMLVMRYEDDLLDPLRIWLKALVTSMYKGKKQRASPHDWIAPHGWQTVGGRWDVVVWCCLPTVAFDGAVTVKPKFIISLGY